MGEDGKYLTEHEAAQHIRYSVRSFRRFVDRYRIPAFGPKRNRYKLALLDQWMEDANAFSDSSNGFRRPGQFTPV